MSVRHSTKSKWRGMRSVARYWRVSCTSQQQQRQALEKQNSGLSYVKVLTIEQCVCRAASSPITGNISSSGSLALAAATPAAEQQYQKPQPHYQNRQDERARNADQVSSPASQLVPARLSRSSRALLPIGKIAAKTSCGNGVCKKCKRVFGRNIEQLSRTHVETHEQSLQHK